ncbi:Hypothetical predicted protein [Olea europaea subsp. europaea]|uniref:AMP-activated protein kinase glycogen-binding domain-containing protein n=1 Tax=Olea europaea subsp. europaea TaxID=158383 RepID=A0A8S0T439_OLEEU|nr:Hypothetical predicted protein [Olea europaea subsp. europaea]
MFTLITTRAHVTNSHHPLLHLNYLVTPSQFCVYNQKRRLRRYLKAANFCRSMRFLEVKRLRKIEGSNRSFRCFWRNKESDADAELEAEIMEFMDKSEKPSMFPTKEELLKAGRMDLVEAIKKKCGWYSLGWEGENVDEDADFKIEELQSRVESCSESSSLGEIDANSQLPSSSSGISLEIGAEEDAGIEGILGRLEKQRNADFGINLENYEFGTFASSQDERESRHVGTSIDVDIADPGKYIRLTSEFAHKGKLANPGGMISPSNEPEMWRTWSSRLTGFRDTHFEAADIFLSENQVERDKASINERIIAAEEYAEALDCHEGSNQNQVQTRLENMELELTTALQFLRSKKEGYIAKEVAGRSSSDLQKVSDAWEFQENELMNSQERLRSIRAKLAVLEGKVTLAIIDAQKILEEKQKRIDVARKALQLLRTVCIVWPKSASEVLLAGTFDGWTTQNECSIELQRKMEKSKTGIFSVYLKLYPGRYEIKFIVDGIWKVDPLRPITHNGRYENNLLIIT